jgi:hypothetical protein
MSNQNLFSITHYSYLFWGWDKSAAYILTKSANLDEIHGFFLTKQAKTKFNNIIMINNLFFDFLQIG